MKLLAPNGKPSNLTPEQYKLVRTPEFKAWFGDWENSPETSSKVVDENGEPLILWHGSKSKERFKTFNIISKAHRGEEVGSHFGTYGQAYKFIEQRKKNNLNYQLYCVFLNIRNILKVDDILWWTPNNINKYVFLKNNISIHDNPMVNEIIENLNKNKINGFKYSNLEEGEGFSYSVFDSNNVKILDGSNNDIRYKNGGLTMKKPKANLAPNGKPSNLTAEQYRLVRTPAFKAWFGDWEKAYETGNYDNVSKVIDEETKEPKVMYHGTRRKFTEFGKNDSKKYIKQILEQGKYILHWFIDNMSSASYYGTKFIHAVFLCIKKPIIEEGLSKVPERMMYIQKEKYGADGVVLYYDEQTKQINICAVPSSNQIKLADGINTTFDGNNPDIRYKNGGGLSNLNIDGYIFDLDKDNSIENEKVFKINDNKGNSIGKIYIVDKNGAYHIENVRLNKERTGVGYDIYKKLIGILDKPIKSGEVQNEKAKGLWDKLVKEGLAKKEGNGYVSNSPDIRYKNGGEIQEHKETYKKWKSLVNMSKTELEKFYNSQEGKDAGLSSSEASSQGISSGRESARWIMRMKDTPVSEWTPSMWRWANKQISFISRMSGNKGPLYDEKGRKTRKHTSLLIWGHNPKKYELGGGIGSNIELINYSVINDFQSGSSLDFYQDLIFVIGDDAKDVVVLYKDFTEAKRVNMFQSETARIPKDVKYDLETSTIVNIDGVNNLLILGSGAKQEFRSVGYLIPLNTKYVVPEPFRYNTFVSRLKREDGIKEINIEGCASMPNNFLLANRGNKTNPDNLLIVTENNFWENQENATISVCRMLLPDKDAAVSELNYEEETDTLFFTASIEHTTNAIDDGNIGDSFLGYIKNISQKLNHNTIQIDKFHNLSEVSPKFIGHKIEGICIESNENGNYIINLVSDNDNDESVIFKIQLKKEINIL